MISDHPLVALPPHSPEAGHAGARGRADAVEDRL